MANNKQTAITGVANSANNGNHFGYINGNGHLNSNGNHFGHNHDDNVFGYAYDKLNIDMDSYIQTAITNGATVLYGTEDIDYFNISTNNTIVYGLAGADIISSLASNTIINGGAGNDVLFGYDFDDVINGGDASDAIFGGAGSDLLNGDNGDDQIYGGSGNDVVNGGAGNDILYNTGNGDGTTVPGNDLLIGGDGNDSFVFYGYTLDSGNVAKILDFTSGIDKLLLIYFNSVDYTINFADSLAQGSGAVAQDANDFIVFDSATGALSYDADGSGASDSIQLATLVGVTSLSGSDFSYSF
jgi:Ca2+-binding RTX toxin-like protein